MRTSVGPAKYHERVQKDVQVAWILQGNRRTRPVFQTQWLAELPSQMSLSGSFTPMRMEIRIQPYALQ